MRACTLHCVLPNAQSRSLKIATPQTNAYIYIYTYIHTNKRINTGFLQAQRKHIHTCHRHAHTHLNAFSRMDRTNVIDTHTHTRKS